MSETLVTPFKGNQTNDQIYFNKKISQQRIRVEGAFGRLKGRFKRFRSQLKNGETEYGVRLFYTACIVHNIIELYQLYSSEDYYLEYLEINHINEKDSNSV